LLSLLRRLYAALHVTISPIQRRLVRILSLYKWYNIVIGLCRVPHYRSEVTLASGQWFDDNAASAPLRTGLLMGVCLVTCVLYLIDMTRSTLIHVPGPVRRVFKAVNIAEEPRPSWLFLARNKCAAWQRDVRAHSWIAVAHSLTQVAVVTSTIRGGKSRLVGQPLSTHLSVWVVF